MLMEIPKISDEKLIKLENGLLIPPKELIIQIHDALISFYRKTKGVGQPGMRDEGCLEFAILHVQYGKYPPDKKFENALKLSVELFYDIVSRQHPFVDGNKRTAWAVASLMLERNCKLYLNKKCQATEAEEGEACIDIAKWMDNADKAPLEKRIRDAGLVPPTQKKIHVDDVKRYISHLLLKYIRIES